MNVNEPRFCDECYVLSRLTFQVEYKVAGYKILCKDCFEAEVELKNDLRGLRLEGLVPSE